MTPPSKVVESGTAESMLIASSLGLVLKFDSGRAWVESCPAGGPAAQCLIIDVGDEVLAVNGKDVVGSTAPQILEHSHALSVICVDDLDAVATDSVWQEAMFHCFNEAAESNVLFVVTASRAPRDLDLSLADLRSRMQKGLIFQLQAADDGFKKQILQHRANSRGISLSDQVCDYILQRADRSLAGLIAVLERLDSESFQRQRRLTVPLVKDVMGW